MNPQQFNMAGMGRGMPNMNMGMNMGTNMGMGMGMNMNMNQNMPQQKGPNQFLAVIYQSLNQSQQHDGPFTGWRANVSLQERAGQIKVLFDSLRMLGASVDTKRSLDIALAFERKQFTQSSTHEAYKQSIHEKLGSIRDQRQQQATNTAGGMPNNMGMMNNFQPQQQMGGMNNMNNINFQQGMQVSPNVLNQPQGSGIMNNQQLNKGNNPAAQQTRPNAPELSTEDNKWINSRAAEMAKSTSKDDMASIVESMDPRVRVSLSDKKIDPIIYHFRMAATREFRQQQAGKGGMNPNMPRMQTPVSNAGLPVTQANATPFMNNLNLDQFRGQQEEGMRSQKEGQLVVPASNQSVNQPSQNDLFRAQQRQIAMQLRSQFPNASQPELQQMLHTRMKQLGAQMAGRAQLGQQNQMAQNAGQGQNLTQGMPRPNRMNMLNQPINPADQNQSPAQNIARPMSRPQGQVMGQVPAQPPQNQIPIQSIVANFAKLPPHLQAQLNTQPQQEWPRLVAEFRQRANQNNITAQQMRQQRMMQMQQQQHQHQHQQEGADMQRSLSQQPPNIQATQNPQHMPNGQFPGPSPMQPSLSMGSEPNNMMQNMTPQQRAQHLNAQNQQLRMQQQQLAVAQNTVSQPKNTGDIAQVQMQQEMLIRQSDEIAIPPSFRARFAQAYAQAGQQLPPVLTWRELKEFTKAQNQPRVPMAQVLGVQLQHAKVMIAQRQQQGGAIMSGMQQMNVQNQPGVQAPNMMQQAPAAMPQGQRQVTPQDVQNARRQNPSWNPLSDDQIRQLLEQRTQPKVQKQQATVMPVQNQNQNQNQNQSQNQNQNQSQNQSQNQNQSQSQSQNVNATSVQNNARQPNQQRVNQPATQQNKSQNQAQAQPTAKPAEPKNLKRPNQDDTVESAPAPAANKKVSNVDGAANQQSGQMNSQREQAPSLNQKAEATKRRVVALTQEVTREITKHPEITNMDPQVRQRMVGMLTSDRAKNLFGRFDAFLMMIAQSEPDEKVLKALITHRFFLAQQYKPESWNNRTYQPADHFTMMPENLEKIINFIQQKFQQAFAKGQANKAMPLTQENLSMASKQAAQQQKIKQGQKSKDGPPPAPTVDKPPIQFPNPHGTPQYGAAGLKQEDLKLPPKKKMRNEAGGASPVASTKPQPPRPSFKCTFPGCTSQNFATQTEMEAHLRVAHKPEMESVKDPVGYLNNSLQQAFNLDDSFEPKKVSAQQMARSASAQKTDTKAETPAAMARGPSQQSNKAIPAAPSMQKTAFAAKDNKLHAAKAPAPEDRADDSWADVNFSFEDLSNVFGPTETGDVIPMAVDSETFQRQVEAAYQQLDEYKRVFGVENASSSEGSSAKSKSPDQGSEPSLPSGSKPQDADPFYVDLNIDGSALPALEGNSEGLDLFTEDSTVDRDWMMLDVEGSMSPWEKVDDPDTKQKSGAMNNGLDFDLDIWINDDIADDPLPDEAWLKSLDAISFGTTVATNGPFV